MCGYTRWLWKAQDTSSCIVLYPLQVECHIMSRTKQQWITVVNSWQNKSRYKCGSCSTCQESTNRCQTTQLKIACPSNIGDMCIHSKMTVKYKTHYIPVSNLCFIAKMQEKLVLSQVSSYHNSHNLYNTCQSAYRPGHRTETAHLKVVNDMFLSLNKGNISVLDLLEFSSAFDTIDHPILVHRLHADFWFTDTVLQWFSSYLTNRTHYKSLSYYCSAFAPVHSGVPQSSVLGPILFTMYIKALSEIIYSHSIIHYSFADDLQLQMSAPPDKIYELLHSMQSCTSDVKGSATANMLKLNDNKTEIMLVTSKRTKHLITVRLPNAEGVPSDNSQGHSLKQEIALALILKSHGQPATQICKKLYRRFSQDAWRLDGYWLEDHATAQLSVLDNFHDLLLARLINRQDVMFDECFPGFSCVGDGSSGKCGSY